MKKIKHSESAILNILKQQEQGVKVAEICREHGISEATFYNWKSRYSGMDLSELKRLKELEYENSRLKRIVANQMLEIDAIKAVLEKKF
jgi:putative transposase